MKKVYVIGHRNPDTDSICSAIAYANLKNQVEGNGYEAYRAGNINGETRYVLDTFGIKDPKYVSDVRPRLKDVRCLIFVRSIIMNSARYFLKSRL